jgi:hypothetical protein
VTDATGRREAVFTLLAAAAYVTVVFLTEPSFFRATDFQKHLLPHQAYLSDRVLAGDVPLWNPHVGLGRPFLADLNAGALYPPVLASLLVPPHARLLLLTVLHFGLGALAMVRLGGALGMRPGAARIAALAFVGSGHLLMLGHAGHLVYAWGVMYMPLLFLLAVRMQDDGRATRVVVLAVALALQLVCGHPQVAWMTWLGLGTFLVGRGLERPLGGSMRPVAATIGRMAFALLAAFGLAAVQLGPLFELVGQSNRALGTEAAGTLPWSQWASLLVPARAGNLIPPAAYFFMGAPVLLAGAAGLLLLDDRNVRGLGLTAVVAAAVAAGHQTPVFGLLFYLIPGLSSFHFPARAALLVCLCLALAAGMFLSRTPKTRCSLVALGVAAGLALAVAATWEWLVVRRPPSADTWLRVGMVVAAAAALGWPRLADRPYGPALVGVLAAAEVGLSAYHFKAFAGGPSFPAEAAVRETLRSAGAVDAAGVPPRVSVSYLFVRDNGGMLHGYSTFSAYVPLYVERVWVYLHESLGIPVPGSPDEYPAHAIFERGPFPYDSMSLVLGMDLATGELRMRPDPDPRVYLAPAARQVRDWREALVLMKAGHDFHRTALVEEPVAPGLPADPPLEAGGRARIVSFTPERVVVETEGAGDALLVLAEAWFPGWTARVDGREAPCRPANVWMRAVPVPGGRHRVELQYRSTYLVPGACATAATAALLAAALVRDRRARRRGGPLLTSPASAP